MTARIKTIIYPVKDLTAAKALYRALLGVDPAMDEPYYVQFNVGHQELGLDPHGHDKNMTGPVCYWQVDDIETAFKLLLDSGAESQQEISEVGGGRRIASVKDADGNVIGLVADGS